MCTLQTALQSLETDGYIAKKMERRLDKTIKYVMVSGKKALADAGLAWDGQEIKVQLATGAVSHLLNCYGHVWKHWNMSWV